MAAALTRDRGPLRGRRPPWGAARPEPDTAGYDGDRDAREGPPPEGRPRRDGRSDYQEARNTFVSRVASTPPGADSAS